MKRTLSTHMPYFDADTDGFGEVNGLRGANWRGRDW